MLSISVLGANGRMGRNLITAVAEDPQTSLHSGTVREASPLLGIDAGVAVGGTPLNVKLDTLNNTQIMGLDVVIDFTLPTVLSTHLDWCIQHNLPIVIGTTGLSPEQETALHKASEQIPIVFAANYSVGVNLLIKLAQQTAQVMGESADIEIIEAHHRYKIDSPSGTALALGKGIAHAIERNHDEVAIYGREGHTGERDQQTIGYATIRGGDVVGDHTVLFADIGERIELTHKASSRMTFAKGAVRAAKWVKKQPPGLYSMMDVLGL